MKNHLFSRASTLAIGLAVVSVSPAVAQTTEPESGDIIVTATRESSLASKTPIALTAITGDQLRSAGVLSPTSLTDQVANLSIVRGNGLQITIRGITSTDGTEKGDPSAAFLLDGNYIARPQAQDVSFFDIERVEVLRGPQGTLYGKNTTAGVVNVLSNRPTDNFGAAVNGSYGNYGSIQADAMVNIPAGDALALRAAVSYDKRDSYLSTAPGDRLSLDPFRENIAGRVSALIKFTPDFTMLLRADYADLKGSRYTTVRANRFFSAVNDPLGNPVYSGSNSATERTLSIPLAQTPKISDQSYGGSAEMNWDTGPVTLTYLGSIRKFKVKEKQNFDLGAPIMFAADFNGDYTQDSHELRVALNDGGPLKLQAGGYYFHEKSAIELDIFGLLSPTPGTVGYTFGFPQAPTITRSYAGFAQGTYAFTPAIRLTLGARYSKDYKFRFGHTIIQKTPIFSAGDVPQQQNSATIRSEKLTWRAGLDADVGARGLLYGSVATGYKAGGFNDGCEAGTTTFGELCNQARPLTQLYYQPETLTAYEIGYKGRFANDVVRVNASAFYYDYKNLQLSTVANFGGGPAQTTTNAGKARVKGIELETILTPDTRSKVTLQFNYLDAEYVQYCPLGFATGSTTACLTIDYAGRPLDRSPKMVTVAGYNYTLPLGSGGNIVADVRTRFSSKSFVTAYGIPAQYVTPAHSDTSVSITYNAPGNRWYLQAFGNNLEDTITVNGIDSFGSVTPGDPRTYGVRAGLKF
jgi:iron complex outermembrane recepter protein